MYTVAYRLTGHEAAASDLAMAALAMTAGEYGWQPRRPVPPEMPLASIKEVFRLFLAQPWPVKTSPAPSRVPMAGEPEEMLQDALLALKPLERAAVVWRYVTGFKVAELAPVAGEAEQDLYRCLSRALHAILMVKVGWVRYRN